MTLTHACLGLEIDEIQKGEFRSLSGYRADLQNDQQKRAQIAAEAIRQADRQVSIRSVNSALTAMGLPTIRHEAWKKNRKSRKGSSSGSADLLIMKLSDNDGFLTSSPA